MAGKIRAVVLGGRILGYKGLELLNAHSGKVKVELFIPHTNPGESGSDWNPPISPLARKKGIKVLTPKTLRDEEAIGKIRRINPDIILNLFCNRFIPEEIIKIPRLGVINFHYGKLPRYRGRFVVTHIILNGEKETCATAHYMDKGLDTGDVIYEERVKIRPDDTARTLYFRCTEAALVLLERVIKNTAVGKKLPRKKQKGAANYYPFEEPNGCRIDLNWTKTKIERFIRALTFEPISTPLIDVGDRRFRVSPIEKPEESASKKIKRR
jgi:methionyl-tRNA formyltransferase